MARNKPITLSGTVYCDWNAFTFVSPAPDRLALGDLVIWSWSGDSENPSSKSSSGVFAVSVFDGKQRRRLKVKHSRVHNLLPFSGEDGRERKLSQLVRELRALKGRVATQGKRGFEVTPLDDIADHHLAPATPKPTTETTEEKRTAAPAKPSQGTLF